MWCESNGDTEIAKKLHFRHVKKKRKPLLNAEKAKKRLDFAMHHYTNNTDTLFWWFGDESRFECVHENEEVIGPGEQRSIVGRVQKPQSLMVWGAISYFGRTRIIVYDAGEKVNADVYTKSVLHSFTHAREHLFPQLVVNPRSIEHIRLLHDNAPAHKAKHTRHAFRRSRIHTVENYPPSSPDLNLIEHIFGWMKRRVRADAPRDKRELALSVARAWAAYAQHSIQKMILRYRLRLRQVIRKHGWSTHY